MNNRRGSSSSKSALLRSKRQYLCSGVSVAEILWKDLLSVNEWLVIYHISVDVSVSEL